MSRGRNECTLDYVQGLQGKVQRKKTRIFICTYKVSARGVALICEVQRRYLGIYTKRFPILFHVGVNNISKTGLYRSEYEQIACALDQTKQLEMGTEKVA